MSQTFPCFSSSSSYSKAALYIRLSLSLTFFTHHIQLHVYFRLSKQTVIVNLYIQKFTVYPFRNVVKNYAEKCEEKEKCVLFFQIYLTLAFYIAHQLQGTYWETIRIPIRIYKDNSFLCLFLQFKIIWSLYQYNHKNPSKTLLKLAIKITWSLYQYNHKNPLLKLVIKNRKVKECSPMLKRTGYTNLTESTEYSQSLHNSSPMDKRFIFFFPGNIFSCR